ncbi:Uncharacterized protein FKW44_008879, partial [Caligus rogercresseyi]
AIQSAILFNLINVIAVIIRESYKRMRRWWVKDAALKKVFWCFGNPDRALYADVVLTLLVMHQDQTMKATSRAKVKGYIE